MTGGVKPPCGLTWAATSVSVHWRPASPASQFPTPPAWKIGGVTRWPSRQDATRAFACSADRECPCVPPALPDMWPVRGPAASHRADSSASDPLLAKSAQGVPYRPWPGLTASAGLLKSAEIRTRWCQLWVSPAGRRFADPASLSRSQVAVQTAYSATCLTWVAPSIDVRWRPALSVVIVTHLVACACIAALSFTTTPPGAYLDAVLRVRRWYLHRLRKPLQRVGQCRQY